MKTFFKVLSVMLIIILARDFLHANPVDSTNTVSISRTAALVYTEEEKEVKTSFLDFFRDSKNINIEVSFNEHGSSLNGLKTSSIVVTASRIIYQW